jgi:hypothetical protein
MVVRPRESDDLVEEIPGEGVDGRRAVNALRRWQQRSDRAGFPVSLAVILVAAAAMVGAVSLLTVATSTVGLIFAAAIGALSTAAVLGSIFVALAADEEASPRVAGREVGAAARPDRSRTDSSSHCAMSIPCREVNPRELDQS